MQMLWGNKNATDCQFWAQLVEFFPKYVISCAAAPLSLLKINLKQQHIFPYK